MCTLSFHPTIAGCQLAMNRDESVTRVAAHLPSMRQCGSLRAIYPSEPDGGTWIGGNECGLALALLNWYSQPPLSGSGFPSRGTVIPALLRSRSIAETATHFASLPLAYMRPFRLVAFSTAECSIAEWNWSGQEHRFLQHPWETRHWFSSGFDEPTASTVRAETCQILAPSTKDGLLELHRSHLPERGPFSICVHRDDARSVSCTFMDWTIAGWEMEYHDGPPCLGNPPACLALEVLPSSASWA